MVDVFWVDQTAQKVIETNQKLKRDVKTFVCEMGMGASGVPHIGSVGDGIRNYVVNLAIEDKGHDSKFVAFSDDLDGLRKVPIGFPAELEDEIGKPVSHIKDPFGCHKTFADHISSLLIDALEKIGVKFELRRASEEYPRGTFDQEILEILNNWEKAGKIIKQVTGQDKYLKQLPFLPICKKCGQIYTTIADKFENGKIHYTCTGEFIGKNSKGFEVIIKGCGHEGECGIREGKLAWKVEFAARWRALKVNYEAFGKDILDSVKTNDEISRKILGYEPPVHSFYEMFIERGGKKMSKSVGNVFTPQVWLDYASPESLRLLFLKKLAKTRVVDLDAIPMYVEEADDLAKVYFGEKKLDNLKELTHLKRLYEYVHFLEAPKQRPDIMIPFSTIANLMKIVPEKDIVKTILQKTEHIPKDMTEEQEDDVDRRLEGVENWVKDKGLETKEIDLSEKQKISLKKLADELKKDWKEEDLEKRIFDLTREENISPKDFFAGSYLVLLGKKYGPRLAMLILAIGKDTVAEKFNEL